MIPQPADVKANKNNKQKIWWLYLTIEIWTKGMYFSFGFGWFSIYFDIACEEQGHWQNP